MVKMDHVAKAGTINPIVELSISSKQRKHHTHANTFSTALSPYGICPAYPQAHLKKIHLIADKSPL